MDWIELESNALYRVDKIVEKKSNECIMQVLALIN